MNKACTCSAGTVPPAPEYNKASSCEQPACSLHTVVIPANKGSDAEGSPYAPTLGGYQNAIVIYAATGSVYLYDEAGVFTNLTGKELAAKLNELIKQVGTLDEKVTIVDENLQSEIDTRVAAQTAFQAALDKAEEDIAKEAQAREDGDAELQTQIQALQAKITDLTTSGSTETTDREAAISDLQSKIDGLTSGLAEEANTRADADTKLSTDVENLRTAVENLGGEIEGDTGKVANLPDTVLQSAVMNGSDNAITFQASGVNLSDGSAVTSSSSVSLKTVNGVTLFGTGNIETGGGAGLDLQQSVLTTGTMTEVTKGELRSINVGAITGSGTFSKETTISFKQTYTSQPHVLLAVKVANASKVGSSLSLGDAPQAILTEVTTTNFTFRYGAGSSLSLADGELIIEAYIFGK